MIITCEACGTSYRLKTSMVKETGSKVRCSRCEHVFIVYPPSALVHQSAESSANGVEGTETMEFFGALEAEARAAEEEARVRAEGDTIGDLEAMLDNEGETRPGETTADELFSETESPFFSEAAKSALSLSDLEAGPEAPDVISIEALAATTREEYGAAPVSAESTLDMGELTTDTVESAPGREAVVEMGDLAPETTSLPEFEPQTDMPTAEAPETEELGFDDLKAEEWTPAEALMDIDDLASETGPAPEDARSKDTMDFAEIAREQEQATDEGVYGLADLEEASEEAVSGMETGEVVDMAELAVATGVTVDFDDIAAAAPTAGEAEMEPEAELDLEDITVTEEEQDLYGEEFAAEAEAGAEPQADWQEPEASESARDADAFTVMAEPSDFEDLSDDMAAGYEGEDDEEGGEDIGLDEFEREEESGQEPAGGIEGKEQAGLSPEEKKAAAREEVEEKEQARLSDIDFGLEEEDADTLEFEEGGTLDLDLDEDEFELDLELEDEEGEVPGETEEEFDLDLEEEEDAAPAQAQSESESAPEADEEEFDLDLDFEEAGEKADKEAGPEPETQTSDLEEFDLDFEAPPETDESISDTMDGEDWALDLEDFDLDLDEAEESSETLDLDEDEFDLEFDLEGEEEELEGASEEEPELDLGLDLAEEDGGSGKAGAADKAPASDEEESLEFDLDLDFDFEEEEEEARPRTESEAESAGDEAAGDEFELDLDFDSEPDAEDRYDIDLTPEEPSEGGEEAEDFELDLDLTEEEEEASGFEAGAQSQEEQAPTDKTEEFDLSEIEDFLEDDSTAVSDSRTFDESTELELELEEETAEQTMEAGTDPETDAEDELSLETMLDEGEQRDEGEDKELAMETREQEASYPDTDEAPLAAGAAEEAPGRTFEEEPEEAMPSAFSAMGYKRRKRGVGRTLLIGLIVLIALAALAVGATYYFGFEDRIPFLNQLTTEQAATGPTAAEPTEGEPGAATPTPTAGEAAAPAEAESEAQALARSGEEAAATGQAEAEEAESAVEGEASAAAEGEADATESAATESAAAEPAEPAESAESTEATAAASAESGNMGIGITTNPDYRFVDNSVAGELLVITGNVTNQYDHPRRLIKVKGSLYDPASRQPIRSNTVVAGNVISDSGLATRELDSIKAELSSAPEAGSSAEGGLPPEQSLPFMVVFGNLPENLASFEVSVLSSAK